MLLTEHDCFNRMFHLQNAKFPEQKISQVNGNNCDCPTGPSEN